MIVEHFKFQGPSEYSEIPGNFRPIDSSPRDMGPPSADRCSHLLANWWWEIDGNWVIYVCISRCAIQFDVLQSTGLSWDFLKLVKKCFPCCSCTAWHQRTLGQNTGVSIHPVSGSIWRFNMLSHVTRCYKYLISLSLKSFSLSARHSKTILLILLPGHRFVLRTNLVATANATANATAKMAVTRWLDDLTVVTVRSGLRPVLRLLSRFNGEFISVYLSLSQFPSHFSNLPSRRKTILWRSKLLDLSLNPPVLCQVLQLYPARVPHSVILKSRFNIIQHIHLIWLVSPIGSILIPYSNLQYLHDLIWFWTILHLHVHVCKWDTQLSRARHWEFCRRGSLFRTTCVWPLSEHVGICRNGL